MNPAIDLKQLRAFGLIVGGIFAVIGIWPAVVHSEALRLWAVLLAGLLVGPALMRPRVLAPVYRLWMAGGHALGWVNTRIILAAIFYGVFTPMGLVMRFVGGKDPMRHKLEPSADTYRVIAQPRPSSHMTRQY